MNILWFIVLFFSHIIVFFLGFSFKTKNIEVEHTLIDQIKKLDPNRSKPGAIKSLSAIEIQKRRNGQHDVDKELERTFEDLIQ